MPRPPAHLRNLGRAIVIGSRADLVSALDRAIEPRGAIWERLSDLCLSFVAEAIIDGREQVIAGAREALDAYDAQQGA
tara:strand:+ start:163 stop:396 length:234 start_codon:yes stop_codon:yes gene_type:complete